MTLRIRKSKITKDKRAERSRIRDAQARALIHSAQVAQIESSYEIPWKATASQIGILSDGSRNGSQGSFSALPDELHDSRLSHAWETGEYSKGNAVAPQMTPIPEPLESVVILEPPKLTEEEQSMYETLLEAVKSWEEIPDDEGGLGHVEESEVFSLTRECLLRYLRATQWDTETAEKRLLETLSWRRGQVFQSSQNNYLWNDTGNGPFVYGYDFASRPCVYLDLETLPPIASLLKQWIFMLERGIDLLVPGQETLTLLIRITSFPGSKGGGTSMLRWLLNILRRYHPERLGLLILFDPETALTASQKEEFESEIELSTLRVLGSAEEIRLYVPRQQLWNKFQGDVEFMYDKNVYLPALSTLAEERVAKQRELWIKAGKHYGESEVYLRGGTEQSVYQVSLDDAAQSPPRDIVAVSKERRESVSETHSGFASPPNLVIPAVESEGTDVPIPTSQGTETGSILGAIHKSWSENRENSWQLDAGGDTEAEIESAVPGSVESAKGLKGKYTQGRAIEREETIVSVGRDEAQVEGLRETETRKSDSGDPSLFPDSSTLHENLASTASLLLSFTEKETRKERASSQHKAKNNLEREMLFGNITSSRLFHDSLQDRKYVIIIALGGVPI